MSVLHLQVLACDEVNNRRDNPNRSKKSKSDYHTYYRIREIITF